MTVDMFSRVGLEKNPEKTNEMVCYGDRWGKWSIIRERQGRGRSFGRVKGKW